MSEPRAILRGLYEAALDAVGGQAATARWLRAHALDGPLYLLAVGKAAAAMTTGALDVLGEALQGGVVVTREGYGSTRLPSRFAQLETAHPVPDARSIAAGERVIEFLRSAPAEARFLVLLSGGASALLEAPAPGVGEAELAALNRWLLGSGLDIHAMNRIRRACSRLKGGRLAGYLDGRAATVLVISDVRGDRIASIGSGPLCPSSEEPVRPDELPPELQPLLRNIPPVPAPEAFERVAHHLVATNAQALDAAAARAAELGLGVHRHPEFLAGEATSCGVAVAEILCRGAPGVHLWGGEPVVRLPDQPGRGGRMQALALAAAQGLAPHPECVLLAAGTDGADGPTEDAGACVDAGTVARVQAAGLDVAQCLAAADSGTALAASGDLLHTGPTGTNVMDVVIGFKTA